MDNSSKCLNCEKETKFWGNRFNKYCSIKCKDEHHLKKCKRRKTIVSCKTCGEKFESSRSVSKYCSKKCKVKADTAKRTNKPKIKKCKNCSKEFTPYTSLSVFCSFECRNISKKSKRIRNWGEKSVSARKGIGNPAYVHGNRIEEKNISGEGHRFYLRIRDDKRQEMLNKFGYLFCERCGTNHSYQWEMHHIVYRSEAPNHPNLHHKDNLINLCVLCHNWFHKSKKNRNEIVAQRNLVNLFDETILR